MHYSGYSSHRAHTCEKLSCCWETDTVRGVDKTPITTTHVTTTVGKYTFFISHSTCTLIKYTSIHAPVCGVCCALGAEIASQHVHTDTQMNRDQEMPLMQPREKKEKKKIKERKTQKQSMDGLCLAFFSSRKFLICPPHPSASLSLSLSLPGQRERERVRERERETKEAYTSVRFNAASSCSALVSHSVHHQ